MALGKICTYTKKAISVSIKELEQAFSLDVDENLETELEKAKSGETRVMPEFDTAELSKYGFDSEFGIILFFLGIKEVYIKGPNKKGLYPKIMRFTIQNFDIFRDLVSFMSNYTDGHQKKLYSMLYLCNQAVSKMFVHKPYKESEIPSLLHSSVSGVSPKDEKVVEKFTTSDHEVQAKFDSIMEDKLEEWTDKLYVDSNSMKQSESHPVVISQNILAEYWYDTAQDVSRLYGLKAKSKYVNKMGNNEDDLRLDDFYCSDKKASAIYKGAKELGFKVDSKENLQKYLDTIDASVLFDRPEFINTPSVKGDGVSKSSILELLLLDENPRAGEILAWGARHGEFAQSQLDWNPGNDDLEAGKVIFKGIVKYDREMEDINVWSPKVYASKLSPDQKEKYEKWVLDYCRERSKLFTGTFLNYFDGKDFKAAYKAIGYVPEPWENVSKSNMYLLHSQKKAEILEFNGLGPWGFHSILGTESIYKELEVDGNETGYGNLKYALLKELLLLLSPKNGEDFYQTVKDYAQKLMKQEMSIDEFLTEAINRKVYNLAKSLPRLGILKDTLGDPSIKKYLSNYDRFYTTLPSKVTIDGYSQNLPLVESIPEIDKDCGLISTISVNYIQLIKNGTFELSNDILQELNGLKELLDYSQQQDSYSLQIVDPVRKENLDYMETFLKS